MTATPLEPTPSSATPSPATPSGATHAFEADVDRLLRLVIESLYSHREVFLRELVSNASDALDKLRFRGLTEPGLIDGDEALAVRVSYDKGASTITIDDNGIGMSHDEMVKHLGTIAHSGTRAFLEAAKASGGAKPDALIGQFGVGFYSAYLVADRVDVVSRAAGSGGPAWRWSSEARGTFTVEEADRGVRGTSVTLHLKADARDLADEHELQSLITRYSDYVSFPILLRGASGDWKQVNRATALWQRPPAEVSEEQYDDFYRHLTHDTNKPLARTHFRVEGTHEFAGVLYVPSRPAPAAFGASEAEEAGVALFVKRVFILPAAPELLPRWLRFVRGVVDSDDLPLNVSREMLQDSSAVRVIRKQVTKKVVDALEALAERSTEEYLQLWRSFGAILKEGLAIDAEYRERLAKLARFRTTRGDEWVSLSDYVARAPLRQKAIYYAVGPSVEALAKSPYLEALAKRGFEVLLLTDAVDDWAIEELRRFDDKPLVSAMREDLDLGTSDDDAPVEAKAKELEPFFEKARALLGKRVSGVRASHRLTDSPCCLVVPAGAMHASTERLLRATGASVPDVGRVLELNPTHPLVARAAALAAAEPESPKVASWVGLLFDEAVLLEGGRLEDPADFIRRMNELLA